MYTIGGTNAPASERPLTRSTWRLLSPLTRFEDVPCPTGGEQVIGIDWDLLDLPRTGESLANVEARRQIS